MYKVDLNCDMGESYGLYQLGNDAEMMPYISSANIACGYHAGDPTVMRQTVELAKAHGVAIGAHPGFPDLGGFGRRRMDATLDEFKNYITYQIGALQAFATALDVEINHCKPHGAMYMMAMEDEKIARVILEAVAEINSKMIVSAMNNSAVVHVADQIGIQVAKEVYADREHTDDGSIILTRAGSNIEDYQTMADRVARMVIEGKVVAHSGNDVPIVAETICIHGDTPGAPELVKTILETFKAKDIEVTPARQVLASK